MTFWGVLNRMPLSFGLKKPDIHRGSCGEGALRMENLTVKRSVSQGQAELPRRLSRPVKSPAPSTTPPKPKLLDQVRQAIRVRHYRNRRGLALHSGR